MKDGRICRLVATNAKFTIIVRTKEGYTTFHHKIEPFHKVTVFGHPIYPTEDMCWLGKQIDRLLDGEENFRALNACDPTCKDRFKCFTEY